MIFCIFFVIMYVCYICGLAEGSVTKFRSHLRRHQDLAEIRLPILCLQVNCSSSFSKIYNFMRHLESFHVSEMEGRLFESANVTESFSDATAEPDFSFEIADDQSVVSADSCLDDVQREEISLVASRE